MRELLSSKRAWLWGPELENTFKKGLVQPLPCTRNKGCLIVWFEARAVAEGSRVEADCSCLEIDVASREEIRAN